LRASMAEVLTKAETLKQIAVKGKIDYVIEWIRNFLESDEKLVVFATHKTVVSAIMEAFPKIAVKIDGSLSTDKQREDAKVKFQTDDKIRLFVGQTKAASEGINLTASSTVAFVELPWTPGNVRQCEDRCHRIGQKDTVNVNFLLAFGTIEEKIAKILDSKRKLSDNLLDGKESLDTNILTDLLKQYLT
jgi:SWI/SNF-related matrix-associated actin-dependent regulator of chromatin subfamily A-like protein 1